MPLTQYTSKQDLKDRQKRRKWAGQNGLTNTATMKDSKEKIAEVEVDEEMSHLEVIHNSRFLSNNNRNMSRWKKLLTAVLYLKWKDEIFITE